MTDDNNSRHYPSPLLTGPLHDDFTILYNRIYEHDDEIRKLKATPATPVKGGEGAKAVAGGPSTTKIGGLYVKGVPPAHQQALMYNAQTGQYEPTAVPPVITTPPVHSTSPGTTNQMVFSGGYLYICVAPNSWQRVAIAGGF